MAVIFCLCQPTLLTIRGAGGVAKIEGDLCSKRQGGAVSRGDARKVEGYEVTSLAAAVLGAIDWPALRGAAGREKGKEARRLRPASCDCCTVQYYLSEMGAFIVRLEAARLEVAVSNIVIIEFESSSPSL